MPFTFSAPSRAELNLKILVVAGMIMMALAVSSWPHLACGTKSMEIVFHSANGISSNSFVSAGGCKLVVASFLPIDRSVD
jgi:hypothetical protein